MSEQRGTPPHWAELVALVVVVGVLGAVAAVLGWVGVALLAGGGGPLSGLLAGFVLFLAGSALVAGLAAPWAAKRGRR